MEVRTTHFTIQASIEVDATVAEIVPHCGENTMIQIASFMHNTVMIHNLCSELEKKVSNLTITHLPLAKDKGTLISVYTYSNENAAMIESEEFTPIDIISNQLHQENIALDSAFQESKQELLKRYFTDSLTSLPNLYQLREDLQDENTFTLVVLSIDNFKIINDFYGYIAGDYLLEELAKRLRKEVPNAFAYRISGSEFALLIHTSFDFYTLKEYLSNLTSNLKNISFMYAETKIYLDLTFASIATEDRVDIFSKVSMALQHAKRLNQDFWIYENRMHFERMYESNLKTSLHIRKAISNSGIVPYFQPIVKNSTGEIVKFESLARLIDSEGNILAPEEFLAIAKTIKAYSIVTKSIIDKTFDAFKNSDYNFSINLSIEDIMDPDIFAFIIKKLQETGRGSQVIFEILESEHINNFDKVSSFITEVKRYGAKIAIDDFGSGYSNFSYLTKLHIDFLKIDGSLIENIDKDPTSLMVVETIVEFARKLNIETIAVHVHSSTILDKVKNIGIDYSQGFLIDKPHPTIDTAK